MGWEFSTDRGQKRCIQGFGWETWRKETTWKMRRRLEDNIKMDHREVGRGKDWIALVPDRDRWRAVVNAVMNLRLT